jgi:hypothetical protein
MRLALEEKAMLVELAENISGHSARIRSVTVGNFGYTDTTGYELSLWDSRGEKIAQLRLNWWNKKSDTNPADAMLEFMGLKEASVTLAETADFTMAVYKFAKANARG